MNQKITIEGLRDRVQAIEGANVLTIKPLAMAAMGDMLTYLEQIEARRAKSMEAARQVVELLGQVAPQEMGAYLEIMKEATKDE